MRLRGRVREGVWLHACALDNIMWQNVRHCDWGIGGISVPVQFVANLCGEVNVVG